MIGTLLLLLLGVLVIFVIIAANGYFVAQEFAYMSVDRNRLSARAEGGDAASQRALKVTKRTSFMLSGSQLGITVTGLLVGYVAEPLVGQQLGELLGGVGIPTAVSISVGTVAALVVATGVQMIFGELYPKNLAIANAEPMARWLARSTLIYLAVFGWLIALFDRAANALLRAVGITPIHDLDATATAQDLERILADSRDSGDLPHELFLMLDRIIDFPDQDVEHAMIPRSRIDTVSADTEVGDVRTRMASAHTRYPVVDAEGEPVGLVELTDILRAEGGPGVRVSSIMRSPVIVPTAMSLPDAADALTEADQKMACVIDEYGGFAGILTMEDLAEELVGEITDEHDEETPELIVTEGENEWRMDGDVHLDEVERAVGRSIPGGDYETLAGLVIAESGELLDIGRVISITLPQEADELIADEPVEHTLEIEVLNVARHVPSEVRIRLTAWDAEEKEAVDPEQHDDTDEAQDRAEEGIAAEVDRSDP